MLFDPVGHSKTVAVAAPNSMAAPIATLRTVFSSRCLFSESDTSEQIECGADTPHGFGPNCCWASASWELAWSPSDEALLE